MAITQNIEPSFANLENSVDIKSGMDSESLAPSSLAAGGGGGAAAITITALFCSGALVLPRNKPHSR